MEISVIPSLQDNYIHILHDDNGNAVVVDPGDATAAVRALADNGWRLAGVLVTHRHADHIGGLAAVRALAPPDAPVPVFAPEGCGIDGARLCADGDVVSLFDGALSLRVIATPGHTLEHIVYVCDGSDGGGGNGGFVLSGDTLFIAGCGRVFEGTMRQMHDSVAALAALPDETRIYCGHEYTAANLRFAAAVEPDSAAIASRTAEVEQARANGVPTVPGTMAQERETNPYLRLTEPAVIEAAQHQSGETLADSVAVFAALRKWKDQF